VKIGRISYFERAGLAVENFVSVLQFIEPVGCSGLSFVNSAA
jgi:hypothetical protein